MSVRVAFGMMPHEFAVFCAPLHLPFPITGYTKVDPPMPDVPAEVAT